MLPIKKLLVPTDFSEPSLRGVKAANELGLHFNSELLMIHVVPTNQFVPPTGPPVNTGYQVSSLLDELTDSAKESMDKTIEGNLSKDISSRTFLLRGSAPDEIVRVASEEKVDAIVIATHGYTGWRKFIFGSVAEKVIRLAECPVITIPGGEEK